MSTGKNDGTAGFTSLRQGTTDARAVESYYDDWAETYDATLSDWQYHAPEYVCEVLRPHLGDGSRVLDVGCGTGLLGETISGQGEMVIDGLDISGKSLELAERRGCYARLVQHDLANLPLPVGADAYDAAASVGVLTYIEDSGALLRDLCRCVRAGGVISFTQRTDLWEERAFSSLIADIERDGLWTLDHVSEPQNYLPGNDDFGDEIGVIVTTCLVR